MSRYGHYGKRRVPSEKAEQALGERIMASFGFTIWRLSQARATMQTPGFPDVFFTAPGHLVAWEAKRVGGVQRPAQKVFQAAWGAALPGQYFTYLLGPSGVVEDWLVEQGYAKRMGAGAPLIVVRRAA